jgi:hypothetical protein
MALKKAQKEGDCRHCSALDILEELIKDIKSGERGVPEICFVAMKVRSTENSDLVIYPYSCSGGNTTELAGLLAIHLNRLISEP